ncbi:MAG TPA: YheC/YheD family protein [Bacillota bacterium]
MPKLLRIRSSPRQEAGSITVSADVAEALGLGAKRRVQLWVGARTVPVRVRVRRRGAGLLHAHPGLLATLQLPNRRDLPLQARVRGRDLRLGPVIGIFTSSVRRSDRPFGQASEMLEHLCRKGRRRGYLVFVFTPADIRWSEQRVCGYEPVGGGWVRRIFPFPDAVYDCVPSRSAERRPSVRLARARLIAAVHNRYFNRGFFDKWEVHRLLVGDERIQPYLPETERYMGTRRLCQKLREWQGAWLKPSGGSLGRGIIIVRRLEGRGYHVLSPRGRWARTVRTQAGLRRVLHARMQRGPYVMQRELRLARYQGRPFDVRILMQRGVHGVWRRTKLYTRVAAPGGSVTNIAQGGEGLPFQQVAAAASGEVPRLSGQILARMRQLAYLITEQIEQRSGQTLGEVALDLGIDESGQIWFLEANSKPFRAVATETGSQAVVRKALIRPLHYAAYLAGFGKGRPGVNGP